MRAHEGHTRQERAGGVEGGSRQRRLGGLGNRGGTEHVERERLALERLEILKKKEQNPTDRFRE